MPVLPVADLGRGLCWQLVSSDHAWLLAMFDLQPVPERRAQAIAELMPVAGCDERLARRAAGGHHRASLDEVSDKSYSLR